MKHKIRRNEPCPCGSGEKYKKCCMKEKQAFIPIDSWMDKEGIHCIIPVGQTSPEQLEKMTKEYQKQIRNSPLWDEIVQRFGKKGAEELLKEFQVKVK